MKRDTPRPTARRGLTLIECMIVVAVIAVLVALFLPAMMKLRRRGSHIGCVNNVKQIGLSFRLWAGDNGDRFPMQTPVAEGGTKELVESGVAYAHFQVMSNELATPKLLVCPEDSTRQYASSFGQDLSDRNVSYFVGVDADPAKPAMVLTGDDNIGVRGVPPKRGLLSLSTNDPVVWVKPRPFHNNGGYISLADDTVFEAGDAQLRQLLQQTGLATNRLAVP